MTGCWCRFGGRCHRARRALQALAAVDARESQVVVMRFCGGLSVQETAEALHVSPEMVLRDWKLAKAWLLRALAPEREERHEPRHRTRRVSNRPPAPGRCP
jgi:DNA-directed RNA polymerase specialized sigma24 family protein